MARNQQLGQRQMNKFLFFRNKNTSINIKFTVKGFLKRPTKIIHFVLCLKINLKNQHLLYNNQKYQ